MKTLPALHELIAGDVDLAGQIRPVAIEDVLGREQVEVDLEAIGAYIRGRVVLVTGGGGSIGSELCRQVVQLGAKRLVLVDKAESALYEMQRELVDERHFTAVVPRARRLRRRAEDARLFEKYRNGRRSCSTRPPTSTCRCSRRTRSRRSRTTSSRRASIVEVSVEYGVERFVFISTDKAAKPKNLLGQSKAVGEWIVESFARRDDVATRFVAVRFGNVLGSSGSVIPIFRRQIERGGPVTVTHPEMTRFFMTIPEAASLVIQAGAMGGKGQVYVLDMGEPVKILDLARQMIELSGQSEDEIKIEFVGSRAGEKMHEELWNEGEAVGTTKHPKIMRAARPPIDPHWLDERARRARAARGRERHARRDGAAAADRRDAPAPRHDAVLEDTLH